MNLDELIQRHLDGLNTPAEAAQLSEWLENEVSARNRYLDLAGLHAVLAADENLHAPSAVFRPKSATRPHWLSGVAQMAAGLVLGGLAVGSVWAYSQTKLPFSEILRVEDGGFESGIHHRGKGVPTETGHWSGDPRETVTQYGSVKPHEGQGMLRFKAANSSDDLAGIPRSAADLWQVIQLPGNGLRKVRVKAWFNAETTGQARFQIIAVAGDGDPSTAPDLWSQNYQMASHVPAASRATVYVDQDPQSWEASELTLQAPATARILVIGVSAFRQPDGFPGQFVDNVSVSISEEGQP